MKLRACNKHKEPLLFSATKQRNHTLMHVQLASYSIKKYCTFKLVYILATPAVLMLFYFPCCRQYHIPINPAQLPARRRRVPIHLASCRTHARTNNALTQPPALPSVAKLPHIFIHTNNDIHSKTPSSSFQTNKWSAVE